MKTHVILFHFKNTIEKQPECISLPKLNLHRNRTQSVNSQARRLTWYPMIVTEESRVDGTRIWCSKL